MEERTVGDYFVVAGLPQVPEPVDEDYCEGLAPNLKNIEPITDITVIFPSLGEEVPRGFSCVERTPSGYPANLNSGSIRTPDVYLCYRRGRDKPPLVDIGVMYEGKERLLPDAEVVISTPTGKPANVNNTNARILLTFRRAPETMPCNELVVTDVCVILTNKGEAPPHAFCLIKKNLNKGVMGSDVYLCYKKSMNHPPLLSYKADVLLRYPPVDRRGFPFPSSVAMFCLPMCATVEVWPASASQPRPVFSTFVLTVADATEKIYGSAVTFYEAFDEEKLNEDQRTALGISLPGEKAEKSIHVNKSICILSHYPFFETFRTFLFYLTKMASVGFHEVPIERYISHLLDEVPFPSPSRPHILMQLSPTQSVRMSHPHDSPLPKSGASFRQLVNNLGPDNCLMILLLVLTEQKLLIHSLRPDVLTAVTEAISVLIFPFQWQCPYIPLCPLGLCAVLQAPVPFLIGVDSRFFDLYEPPSDATCVDLDTMTITVSEDKRQLLNVKLLPKKPARVLKHTLETLQVAIEQLCRVKGVRRGDAVDVDFQYKKERMLELEIQEAFLRFMTGVLKGYRSFLVPIRRAPTVGATDASSLFDFQGFQRSRDKNYQKFYHLMLRTQMFFRFIEERSFVSDIDTGLAFFDECLEKVEQDDSDTLKLVDINEGNQSERTVFVMPPEPTGLPPNVLYEYNSVFRLNEELFGGSAKMKARSMDRVILGSDFLNTPGSPVARRTKQEIKSAKKNAIKYSENPMHWAKYLLSTCYSLWFIHLPSYLTAAPSKHMALCLAYEMLVRMAKNRLQPADEVCYRVVMQLCGLYNQPVVAVKVLFEMKRCGMTPNAITYGYYNKAVLEAQWPSNVSNSSQLMWIKLRNVIFGVARFRAAGRHRRQSLSTTDEVDRLSTGSGGSLESQTTKAVAPSPSESLLSPPNGTLAPEVPPTSARVSASSDVGYGSMHEQEAGKVIGEEADGKSTDPAETTKKFWGKMGQSFDSWVKTGVSQIANVAALAAESSYYSPVGLMSNYSGDYSTGTKPQLEDEEEDFDEKFEPPQFQVRAKCHRKLDFSEPESDNTIRLLRSVSFGNDKEIMSKLKELREELKEPEPEIRATSEESNGSLETKVNQFYDGTETAKSGTNSREITPVDEECLPVPTSPSTPLGTSPSLPSPARTPVTQNDPLGALGEEEARDGHVLALPVLKSPALQGDALKRDSPKRTCSEGNIGSTVSLTSGQGLHNGGVDLSGTGAQSSKSFHRSSTLPNYASTLGGPNGGHSGSSTPSDNLTSSVGSAGGSNTNVVSSFTAFGSSLKSFSRYSPARYSLRKAGTQFLESTIGNKKAEAFMEGFSQLKSAATVTAKKKLDEFKEVINNSSPANRNGPFGRFADDGSSYDSTDLGDYEGAEPVVDQWASVSESYLDQILTTVEPGSTRASFASGEGPSQQDTPLSSSTQSLLTVDNMARTLNLGGPVGRKDLQYPVAIELSMTTCSLCHHCSSLLFDEEIMAGWTAEESSFNTKCPHCRKWEVPFLEVTVRDFRHAPLAQSLVPSALGLAPSLESMNSSAGNPALRRMSLNPSLLTPNPNQGTVPCRKFSLNPTTTTQLGVDSISAPPSSDNGAKDTVDGNTCSGGIREDEIVNTSGLDDVTHCVNGDSPTDDPLGALSNPPAENKESTVNPELTVTSTADEPGTEALNSAKLIETSPVEGIEAETIIVPYLSPLVLRKELENVLEHEGDSCLLQSQFVDEHPIIYWNMVWFFHRGNLTSHMKGLALHANSTKPSVSGAEFLVDPSWEKADHRNVVVKCRWDNPKFHSKFGLPLYVQWLQLQSQELTNEVKGEEDGRQASPTGKSDVERLMNEILRYVARGDVSLICPTLLHHYHKQRQPRHFPAYRDILFLAMLAGGKEAVDVYGFGFDRDYRNAYSRLRNSDEYETMDKGDTPPPDTALFCRKFFKDLTLL